MKHIACIFTLITLLISSCATLNISEIKNLERIEFDSLILNPDRETNNLRIDLIRQNHVELVNDSTTNIRDTPYHPLGFDLGNGLFYDLNENFSFRVDYLLGFSSDYNFEITKINRPEKNKGIIVYMFSNDSLTVTYPPGKKVNYNYHRVEIKDSVSFMYKNRLKYAIVENDTSLIYCGKRRKWDIIHKLDENQYFQNTGRRKENYQINGNDIILKNYYLVSLTNNNMTLEIKKQGKRENRILYTIEKSKDKIFIYNKKYFGKKIEYDENSITIYQDKTQLTKYKLNNKSGVTMTFDKGNCYQSIGTGYPDKFILNRQPRPIYFIVN